MYSIRVKKELVTSLNIFSIISLKNQAVNFCRGDLVELPVESD